MFVRPTMHNKSASTVMKRRKGEQEKKETPCPTAIIDYNNLHGWCRSCRPDVKLLLHDNSSYAKVVEKGVLEDGRHVHCKLMNNFSY